jgi:hypothetical protein
MNIKLDDDTVTSIARQWLVGCVELSKDEYGTEDQKFWDEMREHCQWILENNWHGG